jgi:Xaa-Pro aminopeptidase
MGIESVEARRRRVADAWGLGDEVVLIHGGVPIPKPGGADQCYPYIVHPDYRWLTGQRREGGVLAYDPASGWELFEPPVTDMERVWGGGPAPIGRPIEELTPWLEARKGRSTLTLGAGVAAPQDDLGQRIQAELLNARRPKDASEIEILRRAVTATAAAHEAARATIAPGNSERDVQAALEFAARMAGADGMGYDTIVGAGPNAAIFHATPSDRPIQANEMVLIDAGAEVDGYTADVTRTYPATGAFTADQQWIYDTVLNALRHATAACRIGAEWFDVHRTAALCIAEGLRDAAVLRCSAEEAVESEAIALFFPHGIGHLVGLGVRDASGVAWGRETGRRIAGVTLRMDLPLGEGYLVTVEPGLYFIPALLRNEERRARFAAQVNWNAVEPLLGLGGVRIEDNVVVTAGDPLNLTESIPK